jgi:hypothetical protein
MKNVILLFFATIFSSSTLAFNIPSLPGVSGNGGNSSSQSASDAQEAIVGDFKAALGYVLKSQGHVAMALGMEDTAEGLRAEAGRLSGDDCAQSCLKEVTEASTEGKKKIL